MRNFVCVLLLGLTGCASADIVAQNPVAISIDYNQMGQQKAFDIAQAHCTTEGKNAVRTDSTTDRLSGRVTGTWLCK